MMQTPIVTDTTVPGANIIMKLGRFSHSLYILNKIIKHPKLRELMMELDQAHKKIDLLEVYMKKRRTLKENVTIQEKEYLDSHLALVNLYAKCTTKNPSAILQVRRMVEVDSIYNNLFSEAIPFLFKRVYFRFFFEVYIRTLPDIRFIDLNDDKFVSLLTYVILEDLKMYGEYLPGLLVATPEEEESSMFNEAARKKAALKQSLMEQAEELTNQFDREKQQREIDKFKDYKMKLSPLTSTKSIPLYHEDHAEYWTYLTGKYGTEEEDDGLFHFLIDIFKNIESNSTFEMDKPLSDVIERIRYVLATMNDTLYVLYGEVTFAQNEAKEKEAEQAKEQKSKQKLASTEDLPHLPNIIKVLNYTLKAIKWKQKTEENDSDNSKEENKAELAITDQNTDVQKVLQLVRDHIIKGNLTIRKAFELPDMNVDHYLEMHEFNAMLKQVCGKKATYKQIENATEFIFKGTLKLEEDKKKQDALAKIVDKMYKSKPHDEVINFKYFEQIIRKILKKAGYKAPAKKRERDEEQNIGFQVEQNDIAIHFNTFLKGYLKYQYSAGETHEFELIYLPYFSKFLRKLKETFNKSVIANETDHSTVVYFKNLLSYYGPLENYVYLLKTFIINCFDPNNRLNMKLNAMDHHSLETEEDQAEKDKAILTKLQSLMSQAGVTRFALEIISKTNDEILQNTCVKLLISLLYSPILKESSDNVSGTSFIPQASILDVSNPNIEEVKLIPLSKHQSFWALVSGILPS